MARHKEVFNTREIAHLWAHRVQDSARNPGGNLFFVGDTIYSYGSHFAIARHVDPSEFAKRIRKDGTVRLGDKSPAVVFFNRDTYSVTTAKHCGLVRYSIPAGVEIFITSSPQQSPEFVRLEYIDRCRKLAGEVSAATNKIQRFKYFAQLESAIADGLRFCAIFGGKTTDFKKLLPKNAAAIRAESAAYDREKLVRAELRNTPEYEAIRTKNREKRDAALQRLWDKRILEWRNGGRSFDWQTVRKLPTLLRIRGEAVESSRGANFPLSHAVRILPLIKRMLSAGETYAKNGHSIHLGHYVIDRITADGTFYVGCHIVQRSEVERLISQLESIDQPLTWESVQV